MPPRSSGTTGYPAGYTPAAPPLDGPILPERANYFDAGIDRVFLPGLKLGAPIILSVFNYAHANVLGAEFTGSYDSGNWSSYGNLSIGRERATQLVSQQFNFTPQQLAYIADHYIYTDHSQWISASAGVSYRWLGTHFDTDLIYGSGLREDSGAIPNGGAVAPYLQMNLGVSHRFSDVFGSPLELNAAVINVTDRIYEIRSGTGVGVLAPQYGPRRAFYAGFGRFF